MIQTVPGFDRLTIEPEKLGGQPCIHGYRFSVEQLLELLAADWSYEQIHGEYPFIERADVSQALGYAEAPDRPELAATPRSSKKTATTPFIPRT